MTLEEALQRARILISAKTGIIKRLSEVRPLPDEPDIFFFQSETGDTSLVSQFKGSVAGAGASIVKERAMVKAIGESLERYCLRIYNEKKMIVSTFPELRDRALDPRRIVMCSENQYSQKGFLLSRYSDNTKFRWVWGYSLTRKEPVLVPAVFVYVPYSFLDKEERLAWPISTGAACGCTLEEAIYSAICEVVERDSFTIMWYNKLPMPRVTICGDAIPFLRKLIQRFQDVHLKLCVNDITSDVGIPTFLTTCIDRSGIGPAVIVGAASDLDPEWAVIRSLEEVGRLRLGARAEMTHLGNRHFKDDYSDVKESIDHILLWSKPDMIAKIDFLLSAPKVEELETIKNLSSEDLLDNINTCVKTLVSKSLDVIVVDITTSDVADAGFFVVRVLIPGMQPLDIDFRHRYLGGNRLYTVPQILGYRNRGTKEKELTTYPHPFS